MAVRLQDKVAIVTGAGRNIGEAICHLFAQEGARVAVNDLVPEAAEEVARAIREAGGQALGVAGDVSNPEDVARILETTVARFGGVDVVVNNAAVTVNKSLLETTDAEWDRCVAVTLKGAFLMARTAAQQMVRQGRGGCIINIGSTSGHRGRRNALAYCAAKGGVLNMTRAMAVDLAPYGIRVNSVSPTKTGSAVGQSGGGESRDFDEIPLGRLGRPMDQAQAVLFLASDAAAFITGEDLRVDGGSLATWGFSLRKTAGQAARA